MQNWGLYYIILNRIMLEILCYPHAKCKVARLLTSRPAVGVLSVHILYSFTWSHMAQHRKFMAVSLSSGLSVCFCFSAAKAFLWLHWNHMPCSSFFCYTGVVKAGGSAVCLLRLSWRWLVFITAAPHSSPCFKYATWRLSLWISHAAIGCLTIVLNFWLY